MSFSDFFDSAGRNLRHTFRSLRRHPVFTAAAVLTLAVGIGATTAIFAVVYGVLIKPLPYPDAEELVSVRHTAPGLTASTLGSAESMYVTYRQENRTFAELGLWATNTVALTGLGEPEQVRTLAVTRGTLEALRVRPLLGRGFSDAEYTGAADAGAVLVSYGFWQRRFGGDDAALGRVLSLDSRSVRIIGIMPTSFRFLSLTPQPDVIRPIAINGAQMVIGETTVPIALGYLNYDGIARLKEGVTLAEASADVARMLPVWLNAWPARPGFREIVTEWRVAPALRSLKDEVVGSVAEMLWLLMATVGAVLLIGCANVANLVLARADARRQELAIRAVLGGGARHIAAELMRESVTLGVTGGALGVVVARVGLDLLAHFAPANLPRVEDIAVDGPVLAFAAAASILSSLLFGSIAVMRRRLSQDVLFGSAARDGSTSAGRHHTRNVLIVSQVALALVLLIGAGLMIRTFAALISVDAGFTDPERIQLARIWIPPAVVREPERYNRAFREILGRIAALPRVTAAGFGGVPLDGYLSGSAAISVEDRPELDSNAPPTRRFMGASPRYIEALGARLVAGRDLTWNDVDNGGKAALVSENLARELWGAPEAAIGKRIRPLARPAEPWREIVGVTGDMRETLEQPPPPIVMWPFDMGGNARAWTYVVRSDRAGTQSFAKEVRNAVWASNPDLTVFDVRTMQDVYSNSLARTTFTLVLLAITGSMALFLAAVGIYGVISYIVSQREREIGIRLALGASSATVRRAVVLRSLKVVAIGVAVGMAASVPLGRWMGSLLFGVQPADPLTYGVVFGLVLFTATLAAYLPAWRAAMLDPAETLRTQ